LAQASIDLMRGDLRQSTKYIDWAEQKQYLPRCL